MLPNDLYEVLAKGMRYWFVLLGIVMVLRTFAWQWHDHHARAKRLKELPDAGRIGELLVISGSNELPEDTVLPLPYEGVLGFVRSCDVAVPCNGIAAQHLDFSFQPGVGLLVYPRYRCMCRVDGVKMTDHNKPSRAPMVQGSILTVGEAQLKLCLFDSVAAKLPEHLAIRQTQQNVTGTETPNLSPAAMDNAVSDDKAAGPMTSMPPDEVQQIPMMQPAPVWWHKLFDRHVTYADDQPVIPQQPTLFGDPLPRDTERRQSDGEYPQG